MTPDELKDFFRSRYGAEAVTALASEAFQVLPLESSQPPGPDALNFYGLFSRDRVWIRILAPVVPAQAAMPFLEQLMQANFEQTEMVRYALEDGVLWLVFQHQLESLQSLDLEAALMRMADLRRQGLDAVFGDRIQRQIQQIIRINKQRGQTLESTLQTLQHFYQEGMMGGLDQPPEEREATLKAWRFQLTRLWDTVGPQGESVEGKPNSGNGAEESDYPAPWRSES